jgi:hypothetical protein
VSSPDNPAAAPPRQRRRVRFREAEITRALKAVQAVGGGFEVAINLSGEIKITPTRSDGVPGDSAAVSNYNGSDFIDL